MEYRSSNAGQHIGGAIVAGANFGSGIELSPNSSGTAPSIMPVGDETNKGIGIAGKGTGAVTLGNSSSPVTVSGKVTGGMTVGSSGSVVTEIRRFTVEFTAPTLSSGVTEQAAESTHTVAGLSTGTILLFTPTNPVNAAYTVRPRCSTADELTLAWGHFGDSTIGTGESTNRGVLLQIR